MGASHVTLADSVGEDSPALRLEGKYLHDTWRVALGGLDQGTANLGKVDLALALDGGALFNTPGLTMFVRAIHDGSGAVTGEYVGDAQGISNIETIRATRVYELWSEWSQPGFASSFRVGLYDFNSEFDANGTGALFLNASHGIGKDVSQSGQAGHSIFPVTSLGGRARWALSPQWSLQAAALDAVPGDPEHPTRTTVSLSGQDGALLAVELARAGERLKKFAIGSWRYTGHFDRIDSAADADQGIDGLSTSAADSGRSSGTYVLAEAQLLQSSESEEQGVAGFARYGIANASVNRFGKYAGLGVVRTGVLADDDQLGLAFARAINGAPYRLSQAALGAPTDKAETALELTWRFSPREWLAVQPDIQYILNPNTDTQLSDALALGIRFELSAAFAR
jgi:porin